MKQSEKFCFLRLIIIAVIIIGCVKNNSLRTVIFLFLKKTFLCRESSLTISKMNLDFLERFRQNEFDGSADKNLKKFWLLVVNLKP